MPRPALSNLSIAALQKEIQRRKKELDALKAQRDALDRQIAELEGLGGKAPPKRGRRPGRRPGPKPQAKRAAAKPLAEYVKEALARAPNGLRVKAIEKAVLAAGYPTKAESIYSPIMKVVARDEFQKLDRGVYGLEGAAMAEKKVAKKPGKKVARKAASPAARVKAAGKRGTFAQTADQMVLGLLEGGKALTTAEINEAWKEQGRGGKADNTLTKLVKEGKIKREKIKEARGSRYLAV